MINVCDRGRKRDIFTCYAAFQQKNTLSVNVAQIFPVVGGGEKKRDCSRQLASCSQQQDQPLGEGLSSENCATIMHKVGGLWVGSTLGR